MTRDPIGYRGGINLYGYTANNPISRVDPLGLDWLENLSNFSAGFGDNRHLVLLDGFEGGWD